MARHFKTTGGTEPTGSSHTKALPQTFQEPTVIQGPLTGAQGFESASAPFMRRRRHRGLRSFLSGVLGLVFFAALLTVGFALILQQRSALDANSDNVSNALVAEGDATSQSDGVYLLISGNDTRLGDGSGCGDALVLARLDTSTSRLTLVSIPSDTMLLLGNEQVIGPMRDAYGFSGAESAVEQASLFAGVPISHYVQVNYARVAQIIDGLGGITVNVPEAVETTVGGISAGEQVLDGKTAVAYLRDPYTATGGELGRAQAQRLVLEGTIRKIADSSPATWPSLALDVSGALSTDITALDGVRWAWELKGRDLSVIGAIVPSYRYSVDGTEYSATMFSEWQAMMRRVDAGLDPNDGEAEVGEPQASSETLGAAPNSAAPADYAALAQGSMTTLNLPGSAAPTEAAEG